MIHKLYTAQRCHRPAASRIDKGFVSVLPTDVSSVQKESSNVSDESAGRKREKQQTQSEIQNKR